MNPVRYEQLEEQLRASQRRAAFLAEATRAISSSLDYHVTLRNVAKLAVPTLADWCAVDLLGADGLIRRVAVEHEDPEKIRFVHQLQTRYPADPNAKTGVYNVIRTGEAEFVADITDEMVTAAARDAEHLRLIRSLGLRSYIAAPLTARDRVLGALTFAYAESGRRYEPDDLALVMELARTAAVAIDNALLVRDLEESRQSLTAQADELETQAAELELQVEEARALNTALQQSQRELLELHSELLRTEERLEVAQEAGGVGTYDWNMVTGEVMWTAQEERLFGLEPGTFERNLDGWSTRVHEEDRARVLEEIELCWQERRVDTTIEFRVRWPDGSTRWLTGGGRFFYDDDGRPVRMVGVNLDITERKQLEETRRFLADAAAQLTSAATDVERTLESLARVAVAFLGDFCAIDLVEEDGTVRRGAAAHRDAGLSHVAEVLRRYPPGPELPAPNAIRTGQLQRSTGVDQALLRSVARDDEHYQALITLDPRFLLSAPLVARGRTLGAVSITRTGQGATDFTLRERETAAELARRGALALDNALLHRAEREAREAAERATERVSGLQRVTAALAEAVTPEDVARIALEQGSAILGAARGSLYRLTEDGATLELIGARGIPDALLSRYRRYPVESDLPLADAVRERRGIYIGSVAARNELYPDLARQYPNPSQSAWAAVPLVIEQRAVGGLSLHFAQEQAFRDEDCTYIEAVAQQCAQALERVRLFAAEQTARERAEILAEAGTALSSSLDVAETLQALAKLLVPRVADWCFVEVPTGDGRVEPIVIHHADAERVAHARDLLHRFPLDSNAEYGTPRVLRTGEPELVQEIPEGYFELVTKEPAMLRGYQAAGFRSYVSVPLSVRERVIGVLSLAMAESDRRFGPGDLRVAEELASRAALALDNARLYESAQQARQAAEEANRSRSAFLAVMSHELRTPLNAIIGYKDLLEGEVVGEVNEVQRAHLGRIGGAALQLLALIDQVLSFSRIEAGKEQLALVQIDLTHLLREAASLMEPTARTRGLELQVEVHGGPVYVHTDPQKLTQILLNLLSNAVKFTERGSVALRLRHVDGVALVDVADTGVGIAREDLDRIFEPFEQVDNSATRRYGGTGLGLSVSRELARLIGGDIFVQSDPGRGSTFTLVLAASSSQEQSASRS